MKLEYENWNNYIGTAIVYSFKSEDYGNTSKLDGWERSCSPLKTGSCMGPVWLWVKSSGCTGCVWPMTPSTIWLWVKTWHQQNWVTIPLRYVTVCSLGIVRRVQCFDTYPDFPSCQHTICWPMRKLLGQFGMRQMSILGSSLKLGLMDHGGDPHFPSILGSLRAASQESWVTQLSGKVQCPNNTQKVLHKTSCC